MYRIRNDLAYAKATGHEQLRRKWKMLGNYGRGLSLCDDGRIRPNIIADIQPAGYHKVYKITLVNGATIRVTGNHKFPTNYGEMTVDGIVRMARLAPHKPTSLYVCGEYEQTDFTKYKWSEATNVDREKATGKSGKGANGPENRWYTNGSYTKFMEFKNSGPHCCFDCSADAMMSRIEVHHINGDRSNSEPENLMKLCASCHKKREYAAGRTKRGEKGYPAIEVSIERIEEDGECMTYDVTMGAPNHTFVVDSGIVTCNSHAVGYGLTSYHTAYAKAHFPLQFYTSYLYYAKEKQDPLLEIKELFNDAKSFDIKVLPPRFAELRPHFNTNGVVITFGLSDIKGIGEAQVLKMREAAIAAGEHLGKPCTTWSWYDFLVYFSAQIDSAAVKKMVESGAILHGDMDRQRMLAEFDAWKLLTKKEQSLIASGFAPTEKELAKIRKEQKLPDDEEVPFERRSFDNLLDAIGHLLEHPKGVATAKRRVKVDSIYKLLKNPPRSLKDSVDWVSRTEQQNLGVSLTCSRTSRGDTSLVNLTCKAYREGRGNDDYIVLGVTVEDLREVEVRTGANAGKKMAFVTVSDETGMLDDVTFFSDAWEQFSNDIFPGAPLMMQGKRDLKRGSFLVEKLWRL
jgi:5-methylcytosine-specific restriction endonuclease McrA